MTIEEIAIALSQRLKSLQDLKELSVSNTLIENNVNVIDDKILKTNETIEKLLLSINQK
jgi:hypothetical protein